MNNFQDLDLEIARFLINKLEGFLEDTKNYVEVPEEEIRDVIKGLDDYILYENLGERNKYNIEKTFLCLAKIFPQLWF